MTFQNSNSLTANYLNNYFIFTSPALIELLKSPLMIRSTLYAVLFLLIINSAIAQTTVYLRPNGTAGKDAYTSSYYSTTNFGTNQSLIIADVLTAGTNGSYKSLLAFDLTSIPAGSTITSAQLSLFNDPTSAFNGGQHSTAGGSNSFKIWRIINSWTESTVTNSALPGFTSTNAVIVAASTSNNQNFTNINVQGLVTDMINNPSSSYGFYITLLSGVYTPLRCLVLASSDHADSTKRPLLVVTYSSGCTATISAASPTTFCTGGSVMLTANAGNSYQWKLNGVNISGAIASTYTATSAGSYTVAVTTGTCTATSSAVTVTVNTAPTATITAAGPTSFCHPGSVTLNANTGTGYTYQWKLNGVNISGATFSGYSAAATGSFTVTVTSGGCSTTSSAIAVTSILPTAGITANGGYVSIACLNGGVNFNATTGTGYTYQWKLNGNNISGATAATYSTSTAGNYSCQISSGTCSKLSNSINAQYQTAVTNVNGSTTFCTGGPTLSTTTNIGTSSLTYQWQNNNVDINGANAWNYVPSASGSYRCVITSGTFCNAATYSNSVSIQAGVAPQIGIVSSNGQFPVSICTQQPVDLMLIDASTGSVWPGGTGIQWYKNGNAIVDGTGWGNTLSSVLESGLYNVTLTTSCGSSSPSMPFPVVNIYSAYISVGGSNCSPALSLEPNMVSFAPYQWYLNGNILNGANSPTHTATASGNYTCQITNGCGTNVIGPQYASSGTPNPVISATGSTTNCGGSVTLTANSGSGWNYWWRKNGVTIAGANSSSYTATSNGTYSVEVGTTNNCYAVSNTITVLVAIPAAVITASGSTTFCSGGSVNLTATASTGQSYQWKLNGVNITNATAATYNAAAAGSYTCFITNSCGSVTSNAIAVTVNSVPAIPGTITATGGNTTVCPGSVKTYSIAAVSGATSYTWIPAPGSTVTSGQGTTSATITYNSGFTINDSLRVKSVNSCGSSYHRALSIKRNNPATPGAITGLTSGLCNMTAVPYSVTNVSGITYNWYFYNSSGTVASGQGTNAITVNYINGIFSDSIKVTASNACGTSAVRKASVKAVPATPGVITGSTSVCANQQGVPYSIAAVATATSYTWTGPTGSHISDGNTTSSLNVLTTSATSVTVNYGAAGGTLKVKANNPCGSGTNKSITISIVCRLTNEITTAQFDASIHPNPSRGEFQVSVLNYTDERNSITIKDMQGRLIFQNEFETADFTIPAAIINSGIYIAEVKNSRGSKFIRIVKN
jgi:hypothetical protein